VPPINSAAYFVQKSPSKCARLFATLRGYARVSTTGQNLDAQRAVLKGAGCEVIHEDQRTGANVNRPGLTSLIDESQAGDVVIVARLDRLARSTRDLLNIMDQLAEKAVGFRSLAEPWADTTSAGGKLVMTIFAGIAEFERSLIAERAAAGREAARARGVHLGRPPALTAHQKRQAKAMLKDGAPVGEIAATFGVSASTIRRLS